ncbi:methyltransferase small domain protein, putative [Actinidia rufa]|uniref:Methyltransferase small domain protein, putative n=1 Tax=Actinidia rufa TaxID=165716 RepID=A0A7J0DBK3_9ERIC|nr:methyltransferase small domain protein, putative [Actinidia rufa]
MGQVLSNILICLCGDTAKDEFQGPIDEASPLLIFPPSPSPIPELLQIPPSSSTGSDSVVTNSVSNPSPGANSIEDSASPSSESTSDESDSVSPLERDLVIILPKWLEEFLRDSSITVDADTSEESEVLKEVRERDEERETFTSPSPIPELLQIPPSSSTGSDSVITNSVSNPSPGANSVEDSASPSSESTSDETDSVSPLGRDLVIILPKWLEEFLRDSSITVGADTSEEREVSEVLKEVRERDEERETFTSPSPSPSPELLQIPLSSCHGLDSFADSVTNSIPIPPPGSDPVPDSTSLSSEAKTLPKWLDVFLVDSSITVLEEKKEVVCEVLREERERIEERGGGAKVGRLERWMKHYSSFQKILLVGEGDFSFSACLAVAFGCAHNIIATSLDSRGKSSQ